MTFFRSTVGALGVLLLATAAAAQTSSQPAPTSTVPTSTAPTAAPSTAAPSAQAEVQGGTPTYLRLENPQQRLARLGTAEDPGPNPDPSKHFARFGHSYHIEKFERRWAVYTGCQDEGWIRPFGPVNSCRELYQHNRDFVWVWVPDPDPNVTEATAPEDEPKGKLNDATISYYASIRPEFFELKPADSNEAVRFVEASDGLPKQGSFRNSAAVADVNEDGYPDLILPPERGTGTKFPAIYLGDGKGHWKLWQDVKWPKAQLDYGTVVAADFNKDGHVDLAFGIHLRGVAIFLGDGKGKFTDVTEGLPRDFATRRVVVGDFDRDGWPDVAAISEGPAAVQSIEQPMFGKLRLYLNRNKGKNWKIEEVVGKDAGVAGDFLTTGNFNSDKVPDFITASIYFNSIDILWLSDGPLKWKYGAPRDGMAVPMASYYYASTAGKFTGGSRDDAIVSYVRFWPSEVDEKTLPAPPAKSIAGVDRYTFGPDGVKRTPIMRWETAAPVWGMASADFNGDGKRDVAFTRFDPRDLVLLLGDGKGGFSRAKVEGVKLASNANYDLQVADVNGDGRPDLIVMYEAQEKSTPFGRGNGSVHVYLNEGTAGLK